MDILLEISPLVVDLVSKSKEQRLGSLVNILQTSLFASSEVHELALFE